METHYTQCFKCRNSNSTQAWWNDDNDFEFVRGHTTDDYDVFEVEGAGEQYISIAGNVAINKLMTHGSRTLPSKRGFQMVSVNNTSGKFKDELQFVQKHVENKRQAAVRQKKKQDSLQKAVKDIHMRPIHSLFSQKDIPTNVLVSVRVWYAPSIIHYGRGKLRLYNGRGLS